MNLHRQQYSAEHDERRDTRFETEEQSKLLNLRAALEALPPEADRAMMLQAAMGIYTDADPPTVEKNVDDALLMMNDDLTRNKAARFKEAWGKK